MKHGTIKVFATAVCVALFAVAGSGVVLGQEKIGNLVFKAMDELHKTSQDFLGDLKKVRAKREAAVANREAVKKQYKDAEAGTLDRKEVHAALGYAEAKVLTALKGEAKLINHSTQNGLKILYRLLDSISSGETETGAGMAQSLEEALKPRLEAGASLLRSLVRYRDKITDPVINSKLNAAHETSRILSNSLKDIGKGRHGKRASRLALRQRIMELIEQLNALYTQTDILVSMIADKATRLKMITELAAAEAAILAISAGNKAVERFSAELTWPMMETLEGSEETLDMLMDGVLEGRQGMDGPRSVQRWTDPKL